MDFDTLLGQIEASRPDLTESFSLIRQFQKQKKENENDITEPENKTEELKAILIRQKNVNKNLFGQYQQLENNYQSLIEHLDQLAEAIGACPHCWGEDTGCNYCRGRGKPGYFQPSPEYFEYYIKPAILKLKTIKS